MARRMGLKLGVLGLVAGASAWAVEIKPVEPTQAGTEMEIPAFTVQLNGGVGGFTGHSGMNNNAGAVWGVSASTKAAEVEGVPRTSPRIDVEGGYEGSEHVVSSGFGRGRLLRTNGNALLKAGVPIKKLDPYVGVGAGLSFVNSNDAADASGFKNDWMFEIPTALGVDYNIGEGLMAGVRGSYRFLFFNEFSEDVPGTPNQSGGLLSATATLGGRF